jgi:hypothetical protein
MLGVPSSVFSPDFVKSWAMVTLLVGSVRARAMSMGAMLSDAMKTTAVLRSFRSPEQNFVREVFDRGRCPSKSTESPE